MSEIREHTIDTRQAHARSGATDAVDLPLVLYKPDIASVLRRSERTVERLRRANQLPDPLPIPGRPCWSRDSFLLWLAGGRKGRR